jgi:hypothetical protein
MPNSRQYRPAAGLKGIKEAQQKKGRDLLGRAERIISGFVPKETRQ